MAAMVTVKIAQPLKSAAIIQAIEPAVDSSQAVSAATEAAKQQLAEQLKRYQELCRTLENATARVNQLYEDLFAGHSEAIAHLSTEIARKILMRNVIDGDYKIEAIVKETLKNAPGTEGLVIRLNPNDVADCRALQQGGDEMLAGIELQGDPAVGCGECVLESPRGLVQSFIHEHLERIGQALEKSE